MKSKQVVVIAGSITGFGALCNRRGTSGRGEFSEQWWKPIRLFKFLA